MTSHFWAYVCVLIRGPGCSLRLQSEPGLWWSNILTFFLLPLFLVKKGREGRNKNKNWAPRIQSEELQRHLVGRMYLISDLLDSSEKRRLGFSATTSSPTQPSTVLSHFVWNTCPDQGTLLSWSTNMQDAAPWRCCVVGQENPRLRSLSEVALETKGSGRGGIRRGSWPFHPSFTMRRWGTISMAEAQYLANVLRKYSLQCS